VAYVKAHLQRVRWARVKVDGATVGAIDSGLLILLGVGRADTPATALALAEKVATLRIFADDHQRMNRDLRAAGGACLVVSQFTLFADTSRGRRPYFGDAAAPAQAEPLCGAFGDALAGMGIQVQRGVFGAMMEVELCNDGPVTILLEL
jgi:D-tyrosyl-tRNA(Tyr) deacylase